jgi:PAS domain S-box-containing protein
MILNQAASVRAPGTNLLHTDGTQSAAMLAAIPDLIFLIDADGTFLDVRAPNPEELFVAPSEFLGRRVDQVLPAALAELTLRNVREVLRSGTMQNYETDGLLPSGEHAFFENRVVPCGPSKVLAMVRNITPQKCIEAEVRASEERYRVLAENANEGILVVQERHIQYANPTAATITGYGRDELLTKTVDMIVHPDDRRMVLERHRRRAQGDMAPAVYELRIVSREGVVRWMEVNAVVISWEGKAATMIFFTDVTERRLAQHALQLAQFTVEHASQPITIVDERGSILFANEAARIRLGSDLMARKIWDVETALSPKRWARQWEEVKRKGSISFDASLVTEGGAVRHFEVSSSFLQFNGFEYVVRYAHDVTERTRATQTLSASEELLRQVIEQSSDGITIVDEQGYIIEWNRRQEELTGLSRFEVCGHPLWEVQYALAPPAQRTPEGYEGLQMMILQALQSGDAPWFHQPVSRPLGRPDGTYSIVETIAYPIRTRAGIMIGSIMREVMPDRTQ